MKNNKGITLIALVITIIVMLILVGVTIKVATEGKIFTYASNAVKETKLAQRTEQEILNGIFTTDEIKYNSIDDFIGGATLTPLYGDANDDKIVDVLDLSRINAYNSGEMTPTEQQKINSDVNLNGVIDADDITIVSAYLVGRIPSLPWTGEIPE